MSNQATAKTMKPKLRFPEFQDADGWEETTLGAIARLRNGYAFKSSEYVDSGPFQIITIANVQQGMLSLDATKRIAELPSDIQAHQRLRIDDTLISMTGNVGRVCRVTCEALLLNQRVGKLIPEGVNPDFFYHLLQRDEFRNAMQMKAAGGAQGNLSSGDINEYSLHCPADSSEQRKIAECLTSLDEVIAGHGQKLAALQSHKKGLLQQLFPSPGETRPRLRFPEFKKAPEWEEKNLSALAENLDNRRIPVTESNRVKGEIPYYGASGIVDYINDHIFDEELLCVSEDGANLVARSTPIAFSISGKTWVNNHAHVLKFEHRITQTLVENYLNSIPLDDFLTGMAQPKLNKAMLDSIPVCLPGIEEQQTIAECLSSLDSVIAGEAQKLDALKTHKHGLMQQLFPATAEAADL